MTDFTEDPAYLNMYQPGFFVGIYLAIATLTVIANAGVLTVYIKARHLLKKLSNLFLLLLLGSHFSVGLFSIIFHALFITRVPDVHKVVHISMALYFTSFVFTFTSVILVTLDRAIAVKLPFFYLRLTKRSFVLACAVCSALPVTYFTFTMLGSEIAYSLFVASSTMVIMILTMSNAVIYVEVKRQYEHIRKTTVASGTNEQKIKSKILQKKQYNSIRLCLLLVLSFVICWLPSAINCLTVLVIYDGVLREDSPQRVVRTVATAFATTNSIIDPVIYVLVNREVRKEFLKLFKKSKFHAFNSQDASTSISTM